MRRTNQLSARTVSTLTRPGYHGDGGGLYLQVSPSGAKSWIFRYALAGRAREMGLGSLGVLTLSLARARAVACRQQLHQNIDPIEARRAELVASRLAAATAMTFKDCATAYIDAHRESWRNKKHADQWDSTLTTYAHPFFGDLPVQTIDTGLVMKVLDPIWTTKTETATRVRGRIEAILDWASVRGYRVGDNPARWKGHLQQLLPARAKVQRVTHHPALPVGETPDFIRKLQVQPGVAARGLEYLILTAARTGEVIGMTWEEIDADRKLWTVPAARMKAGREHRVALSSRALAILAEARARSQSAFVFPGMRTKKPLSNMAFLQLLKRMERPDLTAHGFRSTFRDWAAEETDHPRDVVEMALAHIIGDKVEAAYRRSDLIERRAHLMEDWARFATGAAAVALAA